jgi:hypothetical protein
METQLKTIQAYSKKKGKESETEEKRLQSAFPRMGNKQTKKIKSTGRSSPINKKK